MYFCVFCVDKIAVTKSTGALEEAAVKSKNVLALSQGRSTGTWSWGAEVTRCRNNQVSYAHNITEDLILIDEITDSVHILD